jgi:tetratricopeptide (TPR) repeat protein
MSLRKHYILVFLVILNFFNYAQKIPHGRIELGNKPDKTVLMDLLRDRQYETLIKKLNDYLFYGTQDYESEKNLWLAFNTFDIYYSALEPFLDEMIKLYPESSVGYAARAVYYESVGWNKRGYGWAKDVTPAHWEGMRNYFIKAINDAVAGIQLNPQNLICYNVLIQIGMNVGNKEATRKYLDAALKVSPKSYEIRRSYMWSLLPRWGGSHEEMLQFAGESEKYAVKNPELKSLYGFIPFDKGWSLENSGDFKSAIIFFNKALAYGEQPVFYKHRGRCYFELENYQKALQDYEDALRLSPQDEDLLKSKGLALHALGRSGEAKQVLETASRISPTDKYIQNSKKWIDKNGADNHIINGVNLDREGKFEEAINEYNQAIMNNPDDYLPYYNRGVALMKLGRLDEAIRDFEHASARNVNDVSSYYNIGCIKVQQNKLDDAILAFTRAINIDPDKSNLYMNRSYAYYLKGDRNQTVKDLEKACNLGSNEACQKLNQLRGY